MKKIGILIGLCLCLTALPLWAEYEAPAVRNAPYSGMSDDAFYKNGGTWESAVPRNVEEEKAEAERAKRAEQKRKARERHYHFNDNPPYHSRSIIWNSPHHRHASPFGFLSPCQAAVQDAINERAGMNDEIWFSGTPTRGQAVDSQRQRYNFSCQGDDVFIW